MNMTDQDRDPEHKTANEKGLNNANGKGTSLLVSVVIYRPDKAWLATTLTSLSAALKAAHAATQITHASVVLVDNESTKSVSPHHEMLLRSLGAHSWLHAKTLSGHGNIGYGAANNRAASSAPLPHDFVLILNPDVALEPGSISMGIEHLRAHDKTVLVSPVAVNELGAPLYLAYRYPSVFALGLRGFAPELIKQRFKSTLSNYQYRSPGDPPFDDSLTNPALVSGCFMLTRGSVFRDMGGFDENFFLYFEDFDLALRISRVGEIVRLRSCRITHAGGGAARKGIGHIRLFCQSAIRFFNKHGWKWW